MRRSERLDAPRLWLPRGGRRGWLRAAAVAALVATAAVLVLFNHDLDAGQRAIPSDRSTAERTPPPPTGSPDESKPDTRDPAAGSADAQDPAPENRSEDGPGSPQAADGATARGSGAPGGECRPGGAAPPSGAVGFPLRLTDPAVLAVVRAGQRVDVLVRTDGSTATVLAADVAVLCGVGAAAEPDGVLYLAVSPAQARALAALGPGARVSVTVRSPG